MMGAFILAGIVVVLTIIITVIYIFGTAMSDVTGQDSNPLPILIIGFVLAALVAATHWMPHVGW